MDRKQLKASALKRHLIFRNSNVRETYDFFNLSFLFSVRKHTGSISLTISLYLAEIKYAKKVYFPDGILSSNLRRGLRNHSTSRSSSS